MSHELTTNRMNIPGYRRQRGHRVKDSLLLIILFIIGVLGTFYILRFAISDSGSTGFNYHGGEHTEEIYVTSSAR